VIDGKLNLILGRRGQGKTLLGYSLFIGAKKQSFFISTFNPVYINKNVKVIKSVNEFLKDPEQYQKIYFSFSQDNDFELIFNTLSKQQNINIFIDEISMWVNSYKVNDSISYMVKYGRTYSLNLFLIARRPQEFNPLLMSQADCLLAFNIQNVRDLDYLNRSYSENFDILNNLNQFEFYAFGDFYSLEYI
jgi:hypothetical protein